MAARDLTSMSVLDEGSLTTNMRAMQDAGIVYARSGQLLVSLNPYKSLDLYDERTLLSFRTSSNPAGLQPHIYGTSDIAFVRCFRPNSLQQADSLDYAEVVGRYSVLVNGAGKARDKKAAGALLASLKVPAAQFALGHTRAFFKSGVAREEDSLRADLRSAFATRRRKEPGV
ncbi:P-loop containing nucleoside triphosphate hydrolase protein [Pavlovales sp. CCMP2436]|nr:P-loop containing nucleoside triphosphate hydrolase protein [Pavlovales sp. CCMP2436]